MNGMENNLSPSGRFRRNISSISGPAAAEVMNMSAMNDHRLQARVPAVALTSRNSAIASNSSAMH